MGKLINQSIGLKFGDLGDLTPKKCFLDFDNMYDIGTKGLYLFSRPSLDKTITEALFLAIEYNEFHPKEDPAIRIIHVDQESLIFKNGRVLGKDSSVGRIWGEWFYKKGVRGKERTPEQYQTLLSLAEKSGLLDEKKILNKIEN